ncbi:MAG TPA: hypothetical protein VMW89_20520 [Desulfatiglandales bacterium]|nr:hypothetical protein [Desulfatiglandales bacterium]
MGDLITKILILILGFLLGISGNVIFSIIKEKRKKKAILDLIRTEIEAFIGACENAGQKKFWDSSTVETLAGHIVKSYSQDRERFISASNSETRQGIINFYLEASALLSLIESHRNSEKEGDGSSAAIGPGTYEGIVKRSKELLTKI